VRIPLRESSAASPVERFTVALEPDGSATLLTFSWGTKRLAVPVTAK
jgi:hypothetical protein